MWIYIHVIFLMIEASQAAGIEEEVAVPLMTVSAIFPAMNDLISEETTATLPVPIGQIPSSVVSEGIREFVGYCQS
jgi:pyruvoyl-dependent arginine decarboxylase (PvlArgDC)